MAAGQFADRVHGEGRQADIHGAHAQVAGGDRANGRATAHVTAHHEALHRHFHGHAQVAEEPGGFAVGGVALVAVDLDHRPGIELGPVVGVVLVSVVGVNAVGVVCRHQQGFLDRAYVFVALRQQALQDLLQHRAIGTAGRARADFFVVVGHEQAGFLGLGGEQGLQAGIARQQVVQARTGDEITVEADHRSALGVVEAQLVVQHHVGIEAVFTGQLVGEQGAEVDALIAGHLGQDRRQFGLRVDRPAFVGGTVEVDRKVGDGRNRCLEIDQLAFDLAIAAEGDAPGQGQVAVEPRGQQGTAVDFHAQLPKALTLQLGLGLDPQAGAVCVRTDHADAAMQGRVTAQLEGDNGRVITGDVIAAIGFGEPGLAFVEALVTGGLKALNKTGSGMKGGRGGLEKVDQALVQLFAHKLLQTARPRV